MKRKFLPALLLFFSLGGFALSADDFSLGKSAFAQKDYKSANNYFVKALIKNPNDATCRYYYAQTLTFLGNLSQAQKEYGYVIQLAPNSLLSDYATQSLKYLQTQAAPLSQTATINKSDNLGSFIKNDSYISKALTTNGEIVTWDLNKMPLKIYIDNSYNSKQIYIDAAKDALQAWKIASGSLLSFEFINDKELADVTILFSASASKTENQTLGLTQHSTRNGYIEKVSITLYTLGSNYKILTANDIYNVALHEFGHMLGLWGHSDNKTDVMYSTYNMNSPNERISLSQQDKNTIKALYVIDKNPLSSNANSMNKIFGAKSQRIDLKLEQGLEYIKTVPGNPIGYLNVGDSYKAMGKDYEAIQYYKKALSLDKNNLDANLKLATIYASKNDLRNAEIYYKNAIKITPKDSYPYCNLINLYIKNNKISNANSLLSILLYRNSSARNSECIKNVISILERK